MTCYRLRCSGQLSELTKKRNRRTQTNMNPIIHEKNKTIKGIHERPGCHNKLFKARKKKNHPLKGQHIRSKHSFVQYLHYVTDINNK